MHSVRRRIQIPLALSGAAAMTPLDRLEHAHAASLPDLTSGDEPLTWLFAGDSITQAPSETNGGRSYRELLETTIRYDNWRPHDLFLSTAVSGWRIDDLRSNIERHLLDWSPDVVFFLFGSNDCVQGPEGEENFVSGYESCLTALHEQFPDVITIVQTPPRVGDEWDSALRDSIGGYVERIRQVARDHDLTLIDHYDDWMDRDFNALLGDGLHPNAEGQRVMYELICRRLGIEDAGTT